MKKFILLILFFCMLAVPVYGDSFGITTDNGTWIAHGYTSINDGVNIVYQCPGTGVYIIDSLGVKATSSSSGYFRAAVYNANDSIVVQGNDTIFVNSAPAAWYYFYQFVDSNESVVAVPKLIGGNYYKIAQTAGGTNLYTSYMTVTSGYCRYSAVNYTAGFPKKYVSTTNSTHLSNSICYFHKAEMALTSPEDHQVFQRLTTGVSTGIPGGNSGPVYFSGSSEIDGTIQAKVTSYDEASVVVDWTAVNTSFASGNFLCTLNSVPQGGWYKLHVKIGIDSTSGVNKWGVGDIFAIGLAQSNAVAAGTARGGSADTGNDLCSKYLLRTTLDSGAWKRMSDPMRPGAGTSFCLKWGNDYVADQGIPVGFINNAISGSWLNYRPDTTRRQWHYYDHDTISYYGKFWNAVMNGARGKIRGVITYQGNECVTSMPYETYYGGIKDWVGWVRSDLGYQVPFFVVIHARIGLQVVIAHEPSITNVRRAWIQLTKDSSNCYIFANAVPLALKTDTVHLPTASLDTLGAWGYRGATRPFLAGTLTNNYFPQIQSAYKINNTAVKVTLNSLINSGPFTGFTVSDSGVTETINSQTISGNVVYLYTASTLGDSVMFGYGINSMPDVTTPMYGIDGLPVAQYYNAKLQLMGSNRNYLLRRRYLSPFMWGF